MPSVRRISEVRHTHVQLSLYTRRQVNMISYRKPEDAIWSSGKRMSADLTMPSVQEPRAIFNSFCCCTVALKDLGVL